jgi:hypothetical protein
VTIFTDIKKTPKAEGRVTPCHTFQQRGTAKVGPGPTLQTACTGGWSVKFLAGLSTNSSGEMWHALFLVKQQDYFEESAIVFLH